MLWYIGRDEAVLAGPLSVDLQQLPADADISPSRGPLWIKLVLAGLWFASSLFFIGPFASAPLQAKAIVGAAPIAGLGMMAFFIYWLMRKRYVHFGRERVQVRERRWFRTTNWSAPYSAFKGVAMRQQSVPSGTQPQTYHIVELRHPNPRLSLPLLVTSDGPPPSSLLERLARVLGLSALPLDNSEAAEEIVDPLNQPLEDLARDTDITVLYDANEPVPSDIGVDATDQDGQEALEITLKSNRPRGVVRLFLAVGPPVTLAFALFSGSWFIGIDAITFAAIAAFVFWSEMRHRRQLVVTRDAIDLKRPWWLFGESTSKRLELDRIDGLYIRPDRTLGLEELVIEAGGETIETGGGLSPDALDWLRRYLLAAIATA